MRKVSKVFTLKDDTGNYESRRSGYCFWTAWQTVCPKFVKRVLGHLPKKVKLTLIPGFDGEYDIPHGKALYFALADRYNKTFGRNTLMWTTSTKSKRKFHGMLHADTKVFLTERGYSPKGQEVVECTLLVEDRDAAKKGK